MHGGPGVGKTTSAVICCRECGYEVCVQGCGLIHFGMNTFFLFFFFFFSFFSAQPIELNASDARNKRLLEEKVSRRNILEAVLALTVLPATDWVSGGEQHNYSILPPQLVDRAKGQEGGMLGFPVSLVSCRVSSLLPPFSPNAFPRQAIIFDEVDGMAGNEDRGGLSEIIQMIKHTKMPIICIANEKNQKMRTLLNYCFELTFPKLQTKQIRSAIMSIAFKEGVREGGVRMLRHILTPLTPFFGP